MVWCVRGGLIRGFFIEKGGSIRARDGRREGGDGGGGGMRTLSLRE